MRSLCSCAALIVATLLFSDSIYAREIHACVKGNGALRLVSGPALCKSPETPLSWNQQGPPGPEGPPGAANLRIIDAVGREVGPLIDANHFPKWWRTFIPEIDAFAIIDVGSGDIFLEVRGPLSFAETGCRGAVYAQIFVPHDVLAGVVPPFAGKLVYTDRPAEERTVLSQRTLQGCEDLPAPRIETLAVPLSVTPEEIGWTSLPLPLPLGIESE